MASVEFTRDEAVYASSNGLSLGLGINDFVKKTITPFSRIRVDRSFTYSVIKSPNFKSPNLKSQLLRLGSHLAARR